MKETVKSLIVGGLRLGVQLWVAEKVKDGINSLVDKVSKNKTKKLEK